VPFCRAVPEMTVSKGRMMESKLPFCRKPQEKKRKEREKIQALQTKVHKTFNELTLQKTNGIKTSDEFGTKLVVGCED
jgi:hypothetical protein